jgi:HlyD family secretion protein
MRRVVIALIILIALAVGGVWAYRTFVAPPAEPQVEREEAVVQRGSLLAVVNATGTILPETQTALSFKAPGRVAEVLVVEGQFVQQGDLLARLETDDLEFSITQAEMGVRQAEMAVRQAEITVRQAESSLASAQTQWLRAQNGPAAYDIAAAEAAVESAKASYQRLLAGPTEEEIRVARANLDQAEASLEQAQAAYNQVADRPDVAMLPQALQLEQATIAYQVAQANFELTQRPASAAERAAAQSAIVQAEASLARLQEGASEEDLRIAQIGVDQAQLQVDQAHIQADQAQLQVEQAQLSLDQARHQLEGTTLTAPHAGTITSVGVKEGEMSGGQPAFLLTDLSSYHVDVTVDEIDIGRVAEGQPVTITLDALPDVQMGGQIEQIAETAQIDSGIVSYLVRVGLDSTDAPLRAGMTANVEIVTERRDNVLLVPNRFVRIDRTTGQAFVDRAAGLQVQPTEIQIGLRDELSSEVLAGLEEGDVVVLIQESSQERLRQMMMGPQ